MTRPKALYTLTIVFACLGLTCLALGAADRGTSSDAARWLAPEMLLLAAGTGVLASHRLMHGCNQLQAQILNVQRSPRTTAGSRIVEPSRTFSPVTGAINELLESSDRAVADSAMRARELEIQLKLATAERQHAEAILYTISDAVLVTDPFDELVLANESAARTFQFDLANGNRAPIEALLHDPKMVQFIREMRQSHSARGRRIVEHQVSTPGGVRTFKVTLSSVPGAVENVPGVAPGATTGIVTRGSAPRSAAPAGVVTVLHDMTREKEISDMKNDFVSMVSHELRTPLASIRAYIEMLIDGEAVDAKTTGEFYDIIQNEANRLGRLIDNILSISKIESGLVQPHKRPQSLTVVVKEALEVIAPQASQKNIQVVEDLSAIFYQTEADRDMLYQAVLNLLGNAVKYTGENGRITVRTTVDEASRRVFAHITDTGVGIPPADLPFVFDKFYRSAPNNGMAQGTGLGLSLVKHIIETVHDGRIFVESQVGSGSTFGFELKLCA